MFFSSNNLCAKWEEGVYYFLNYYPLKKLSVGVFLLKTVLFAELHITNNPTVKNISKCGRFPAKN